MGKITTEKCLEKLLYKGWTRIDYVNIKKFIQTEPETQELIKLK